MPAVTASRHASDPSPKSTRGLKRKRSAEDISDLETHVAALDSSLASLADFTTFAGLPLSRATARGLSASHFVTLTAVQQRAIPVALNGRDLLGAAQTGSGKTLAFLVPLIECLVRARWTPHDGLGALIMAPTRELAVQTFEVLRQVGRYHDFSAGLVIGGKNLREERDRLGRMNILICTPGRMLQHLDQTAAFETGNLRMLVLDEADRIMDLGFQSTVDALVEHLPRDRQTLLFSATQTKKVSDLARLSLRDPEYVSVHESASSATPASLRQNYVVTPLPEKLDTLWSFIRANVKAKTLVFLSSGKQVRFVYETFRRLQPGVPLLHLHGRQKQTARLEVTSRFSSAKHSCLFATDVAARGLDFPAVDWVIQVDCPEDVDTYIHRVGRTARYEKDGRAVLLLDPSEEPAMLKRLEQKKIPIEQIKVRTKKQQSIKSQMQNICFKDPEVKYLGQKAFVSYVKSINVQRDKDVFKISELPLDEFCASLGLPGTPNIKFQTGDDAKRIKNTPREALYSSGAEDEDDGTGLKDHHLDAKPVRTKYDRMFERRNQDILTPHYSKLIDHGQNSVRMNDANEDSRFLSVRRRLTNATGNQDPNKNGKNIPLRVIPILGGEPLAIDSKRRERLLKSKKLLAKAKGKSSKLVYDDDGNAHEVYELEDEAGFRKHGPSADQREKFLQLERDRVREADVGDRDMAKEKRRAKREKLRERRREELEADDDDEVRAELVPFEGEELDALGLLEDDGPATPSERPRKWFEQDHTAKRGKAHRPSGGGEPESLEDLENLASRFL